MTNFLWRQALRRLRSEHVRGRKSADEELAQQAPSLEVVEKALTAGEESYRARAQSVDTKTGLVLATSGVLVALVGTKPSVAGLVGQCLAILAGGAAVAAFFPRAGTGLDPLALRDHYLSASPLRARIQVLNAGLETLRYDEERLYRKVKTLRFATSLLMSAAVAIVVGATIQVVGG
jgi:hypothetical protein